VDANVGNKIWPFYKHLSRCETAGFFKPPFTSRNTWSDWKIVSLSRRRPDLEGSFQHPAIDLLDRAGCLNALQALDDVTHIFHAAYIEKASWAETVAPNLATGERGRRHPSRRWEFKTRPSDSGYEILGTCLGSNRKKVWAQALYI
jgi:hypothetical protein